MSEKVMIIVGSPRQNGNTMLVAQKIAEGALHAGKEVALIELAKLRGFGQGCTSCFGCQHSPKFQCVLSDEISPVLETMKNYDTVVLAGPVYFFGAASQLKAFIDRFYSQVKYEQDELVTPLAKIRFALAVTAGDTLAGSGAQTFVDAMKLLCEYAGTQEPKLFFLGGCGPNTNSLAGRQTDLQNAFNFGAEL